MGKEPLLEVWLFLSFEESNVGLSFFSSCMLIALLRVKGGGELLELFFSSGGLMTMAVGDSLFSFRSTTKTTLREQCTKISVADLVVTSIIEQVHLFTAC